MTKSLPRVLATVLLSALVVFLLAGCGGEETTKTSTKKAKTTKTTANGSSADMPESLVGQVIVPTERSPEDFRQALEDRRPVVVFFYMPEPADDNRVRSSISTLKSRYRGQVEFLDYLYSDADRYGDLVQLFKVNSTPTVVIINYQAQVQRAWTGFADEDSIEQGIVEALGAQGSTSGSSAGSYTQGTTTGARTGTATTSTSPGSSYPGSPSQVP